MIVYAQVEILQGIKEEYTWCKQRFEFLLNWKKKYNGKIGRDK